MSLTLIAQDDFAVGVLRGIAPDQQPGIGLHEIRNGLLDDDGDVYRRGGARYFTTSATPVELAWMWSGFLKGYPVILMQTGGGLYSADAAGVVSEVAGSPGHSQPFQAAVVGDELYMPNKRKVFVIPGTGSSFTIDEEEWFPPDVRQPWRLASIAGRLVVAGGNRIAFSEPVVPGVAPVFIADDFHDLPGGVEVIGLAAIQDTLLVFTNFGLWAITNMAYNLTDDAGNIQQTLSQIVPELSLVHEAGLAVWNGRVVAPCIDRVYLVDLTGPPIPISDSITPLYVDYINQGYRPGLAKVWRNTLLLPMRYFGGAQNATLACRLNRPIQGRYVYYPWSVIDGQAGLQRAFDVCLTEEDNPKLLGAGLDGWISDLTPIFDPDDEENADADGTVYRFDIETRDFPTGQGQPNHVKRVRLRYTNVGQPAVVRLLVERDGGWGAFEPVTLSLGKGLVASWWLPAHRARWARVRFELLTDAPPGDLIVHQIELSVRSAAHAR